MSQLLCLSLLVLMGCKLSSDSSDPVEQLPPITQEGKNTFGFRLNGSIWKPKGYNGTPNLDATYDPGFQGGTLGVSAYFKDNNTDQVIAFSGSNITSTGKYTILGAGFVSPGALFKDNREMCSYIDPSDSATGHFIITKLDTSAGIVSGTFEFTFSKSGCSTIAATEGRFDINIW